MAAFAPALDRIKLKVADLRDPAAAAARQQAAERAALRDQVAASRARTAAVLATAPFPDPADRSRAELQNNARDRVLAARAAAELTAAAAAERAASMSSRVGIGSRILAAVGFETPALREAASAVQEADQAAAAAKTLRVDYRENLVAADRAGAAEASLREGQQERWEARPDVAGARREVHGNSLVAAAVKAGNPEIKDILKQEDGLRIAREILLRKEMERLAAEQAARQQHRDRQHAERMLGHVAAGPRPVTGAGPRR